jgi:hypothetical protein
MRVGAWVGRLFPLRASLHTDSRAGVTKPEALKIPNCPCSTAHRFATVNLSMASQLERVFACLQGRGSPGTWAAAYYRSARPCPRARPCPLSREQGRPCPRGRRHRRDADVPSGPPSLQRRTIGPPPHMFLAIATVAGPPELPLDSKGTPPTAIPGIPSVGRRRAGILEHRDSFPVRGERGQSCPR